MTLLSHARDASLYAAIVAFVAASIYWVVEPAQSSSADTSRFEGPSMPSTASTKKEKTASVGDSISSAPMSSGSMTSTSGSVWPSA